MRRMCLCFQGAHSLMGETHMVVMVVPGERHGPWLCGNWGNEACGRREGTVHFPKQRQTRSGKPPRMRRDQVGQVSKYAGPWVRVHPCVISTLKQDNVSIDKVPCRFKRTAQSSAFKGGGLLSRGWKGQVLWSGCGQGYSGLAPGPLAAAPSFCFCSWDCSSGLS